MYDLTLYLQVAWTSLAHASYQVLFTVAFALVLKVTGIWNFTQSALMGLSFYCMFWLHSFFGLSPYWAMGIALLVTVAVAIAIERKAFATLRNRNSEPIAFFIFTIVFSQLMTFVLELVFSPEPRFMLGDMMSPVHVVHGVYVTSWDIMALLVTASVVTCLYLFLSFSQHGQFLIAVADNPDLAEAYGISKNRYYAIAMVIAAVLINTAMFIFGSKIALHPELPLQIMLFAVTATIIGGIGSVFGAGIAAVALAALQQGSVLFISSRWQPLVIFVILFLTIVFFPKGVRLKT